MCACVLKCGQECVSVFSLVHVVKRGLISSNVIHTVASHYFPSAGSVALCLPLALSAPSFPPSSPLFSLFCPFSCHPHPSTALSTTSKHTHTHYLPPPVSAPPQPSSLPSFPSPHLGFFLLHCYSFSSSSRQLFCVSAHWRLLYLPPRWTFSLLLFFCSKGPVTPAKKKCLRFISANFI